MGFTKNTDSKRTKISRNKPEPLASQQTERRKVVGWVHTSNASRNVGIQTAGSPKVYRMNNSDSSSGTSVELSTFQNQNIILFFIVLGFIATMFVLSWGFFHSNAAPSIDRFSPDAPPPASFVNFD